MTTCRGGDDAAQRRGMLLLLVLSVLALFVVVGAVGLLLAIRAREAARAFAAATADEAGSAALARARLDDALLKLIRGPSTLLATGTDVTESLLEDKYGPHDTCRVTAISGTANGFFSGAVGTVTVTGLNLSNPANVAGRVLTFVPAPNDPAGPTSYRILRVNSAANTLLLANVASAAPAALPSGPCDAVINGREFAGTQPNDRHEPYDAFDDRNQFLTQPVLQASAVASVTRPAFGTSGTTCTVDNDGDGVSDGIWLPRVLPPQRTQDGAMLTFDVSYLVVDLDGRINLNAHGSFVRAQEPRNSNRYPRAPTDVPVGMGYGPADVDAALVVATAAEIASGTMPARWPLVLQGTNNLVPQAVASTPTQWRPSPRAETVQAGRYGLGANANPGGSTNTALNPLNADFWVTGTTGLLARSPTDLKARLQVFTEGSPPALRFARPSPAWAAADTDDANGTGAASHPYRMRLDEAAPRGGWIEASDAIYTSGELERILRQFDADAFLLAPRLAGLLDGRAQESRMTVTTDSWDTPAITGEAARAVAASVTAGDPHAVLSPESVAGLRFNLNRPVVTGSTARQDYFRHLYTLLVALQAPPAEAAQWAANVIEFRDPDSVMSWYPYDPTPLDGVWTTGTGVWGIERPEMVITEASVSANQARVSLYRPWKADLSVGNSTTATGTTERIDPLLGDATTNTLNAAATASGTSVWRVLAGGSSTALSTLTSATAVGVNSSVGPVTVTAGAPPTEVSLQRLADPSKAIGAALDTGSGTNAYVDVHKVAVPTASRTVSRWLHWPNRDLVSHGELLAVPSGDPATVPEICFSESRETSLARSFPAILEAALVPSRFVGANVSVATAATHLAGSGLENFQYGHLSRWREPGRVNVNTILPNAGHPADRSHLDNAVWTALLGRGGTPNPVTANGYEPIRNDRDLLVSGGDARLARSGADAASGFLRRSSAIRLANVATIRSHVFAVWITLRITSSANPGAPQYARLFAIVDRSIPVAAAPGRTLNVRDTIRLQRYLP